MFLNNCIGIRNIKYFVGFLFITSLLCIYAAILSFFQLIWTICDEKSAYQNAVKFFPMFCVAVFLIMVGFILTLMLIEKFLLIVLIPSTGIILLFVYTWICIGFTGVEKSPMPLVIGFACLAYGPWYFLLKKYL